MLYDAHLHIRKTTFIDTMKQQGVTGIVNAATPKEYALLKILQKQYPLLQISAGIHPWNVTHSQWEKMEEILADTTIIGEIGLDNVWCDTDMNLQKAFFDKQLHYACQKGKPVILHIKGMGKEALSYIRQYPNTYLVHWYSDYECLQSYIELGCYFTIGPSLIRDKAVQAVAKNIPLHRLLIESDGLDALTWCEEQEVDEKDYAKLLNRSITYLAKIRNMQVEDIKEQIELNYKRFISSFEGERSK